jgi:hypothetical protein
VAAFLQEKPGHSSSAAMKQGGPLGTRGGAKGAAAQAAAQAALQGTAAKGAAEGAAAQAAAQAALQGTAAKGAAEGAPAQAAAQAAFLQELGAPTPVAPVAPAAPGRTERPNERLALLPAWARWGNKGRGGCLRAGGKAGLGGVGRQGVGGGFSTHTRWSLAAANMARGACVCTTLAAPSNAIPMAKQGRVQQVLRGSYLPMGHGTPIPAGASSGSTCTSHVAQPTWLPSHLRPRGSAGSPGGTHASSAPSALATGRPRGLRKEAAAGGSLAQWGPQCARGPVTWPPRPMGNPRAAWL